VIVGVRSLLINGWVLGELAACVLVILGIVIILTGLSLRAIANYDH
jgi:hypothetical protein